MAKQQVLAFTAEATGIARVLRTDAYVSAAFDPATAKTAPSPNKYPAIWDTGATGTVISQKVVDECGLKPIGMVEVHTAAGARRSPVFLVNIGLPNKVGFAQWRVTLGDLGKNCDLLIGMDIINMGDFAVTNMGGKTVFTFRCPSIERIDFVTQGKPVVAPGKVGRNEPCPCGSGLKYKKCHGK